MAAKTLLLVYEEHEYYKYVRGHLVNRYDVNILQQKILKAIDYLTKLIFPQSFKLFNSFSVALLED